MGQVEWMWKLKVLGGEGRKVEVTWLQPLFFHLLNT